ncbi:hypothetical protein DFR30_0040 [Thiogranum longum]|uniref:Plastocyanin n=1 Tax=Thiogranum longum TaxID=1537524 RepID=A0A4R1H8J2_9GAMM|nr:hypothetical protein [Thiogranum longum]TCK16821.1 hypothetical protein DFR30_0040 [Thiogranum longum]
MVRNILNSGILPLALFGQFAVAPLQVSAAEVKGTVTIAYQGMFEADASAQPQPVSVALLPAQGQHVVPRRQRHHKVEIAGNRMSPAFFTVKKGDSISFVNRDGVYHEIFSLSPGKPWSIRLDRAGSNEATSPGLVLDMPGTTHFFCRIHNKSYARIDVVDTSYLETVQSGRSFHFAGLGKGRWKLRLAAPAAETRWLEVSAITSPPPLSLQLVSRGGGQGRGQLNAQAGVEQLYHE